MISSRRLWWVAGGAGDHEHGGTLHGYGSARGCRMRGTSIAVAGR